MNDKEKVIELIKERSFQKSDTASFPLSSGKMSHYYFNMKKITMAPEGQVLIGSLVFDKIQELNLKPKAVGGLTMGADPIAVATAFTSFLRKNPIEAFVIRKKPKPHGLGLQIEGSVEKNDSVIIVDDVVTTGKSTIKAIKIAREHELEVLAAIVLLDRCEENGKENIEAQGVPLHAILTIQDFL
ncbi:MAG: orotate phosphoribosyltransferase [Deltaproteobacteria bacterium]|nr:orotate phosphoribosyltransferase [Deltaproteobacteria bacterium]MBW2019026.1 orotate phosphoribosyltransferase [Deltaproteobacteria bacterium]MBW2073786.1 orotate phosphoribosyltransferase [Deltaproteobacteria bacterium]RLB82969.1 MAG: orotate phosphoribosyltransferase [Deltaproteobacteria bacterium]